MLWNNLLWLLTNYHNITSRHALCPPAPPEHMSVPAKSRASWWPRTALFPSAVKTVQRVLPAWEENSTTWFFMFVTLCAFLITNIFILVCVESLTLTLFVFQNDCKCCEEKKKQKRFPSFLGFLCFHIMSQDLPSVESYEAGRLLPNTAASGTFFFFKSKFRLFFMRTNSGNWCQQFSRQVSLEAV